MADPSESDVNPHKQLLAEAAAEIRKDQIAREEARPQNVGQGTVRLVSHSLGGAALGAAAVVMGPYQGYKESGPKGIVGGFLGGIAVGLASTTLGIGSGIAHFAQGAGRTASKIKPTKEDPRLTVSPPVASDADGTSTTRSSSTASVKEEYLEQRRQLYAELMAEQSAESAAASMDGLSAPVDNELYQILGVDVDATPSQIRKAYYRMAQRYHPDKHPDDPEATEKFQEIGHAYQVLSDPVKRSDYHRLGKSATEGEGMMDPKALFVLMFADFEHIVGDLATATILRTMDTTEEGEGTAEMSEEQKKAAKEAAELRLRKRTQFQELREAHLVKLLNRRLEPYLEGDEASFINHAKNEVLYLREEPFGRDCLRTTAYIYRKRAFVLSEQKGAFTGVANFFEDIGDKAHSLKSHVRAFEGGIKAMSAVANAEEDESVDETARREAVSTLGAVWLASVLDIESTLRSVVSQVLHFDEKNREQIELARKKAKGLMLLAKIFDQA